VTAILTGVLATSGGGVVATGINTIIRSQDGGVTWSSMQSKLVQNAWHQTVAVGVDASGQRRIISAGGAGTLLQLSQ
jgi:hypothetical protein